MLAEKLVIKLMLILLEFKYLLSRIMENLFKANTLCKAIYGFITIINNIVCITISHYSK